MNPLSLRVLGRVLQMVQAMREFGGEELKDIELSGTGTQVGVRETRRVKDLYVLTEQDALTGRKFDDVVALAASAGKSMGNCVATGHAAGLAVVSRDLSE